MQQIIAQIIGVGGSACIIYCFQAKNSKNLFLLQLFGAVLFCVYFGLLGAYVGFTQNLLAIGRNSLLISDKKWTSHPAMLILLLLSFVVTGILTFDGFFSVLPPVAMVVSTLVMWTKKGKAIRIGQFFGVSPLWLTYNVSVFSISGIVTESFVLLSVVVSVLRFGLKGFDTAPTAEQA